MAKLTFVRESDFKEIEHDYPDFQVQIANAINNALNPLNKYKDLPVSPTEDGKRLIVIVADPDPTIDRVEREINRAGVYRITIESMDNRIRVTPQLVKTLKDNEIFVFGSNESGYHDSGASGTAMDWGAIRGQAEGLQGRTYGIPVMDKMSNHTLKIDEIRPYVDRFISFAKENPDKTFLVIEIGCGIASMKPEEIAPLFTGAKELRNVHLPKSFWTHI